MKPLVKVLSDEEISRIHQSSLTILSKIGMFLPSEEVRDLLGQAGAEVSDKGSIRIPESLIE
jgi:trimethylamine:corrinoid methyltransferase-like protein